MIAMEDLYIMDVAEFTKDLYRMGMQLGQHSQKIGLEGMFVLWSKMGLKR
ncbi:hypothetical protein [Microbulbifer halophilus]